MRPNRISEFTDLQLWRLVKALEDHKEGVREKMKKLGVDWQEHIDEESHIQDILREEIRGRACEAERIELEYKKIAEDYDKAQKEGRDNDRND